MYITSSVHVACSWLCKKMEITRDTVYVYIIYGSKAQLVPAVLLLNKNNPFMHNLKGNGKLNYLSVRFLIINISGLIMYYFFMND